MYGCITGQLHLWQLATVELHVIGQTSEIVRTCIEVSSLPKVICPAIQLWNSASANLKPKPTKQGN